MNNGITEFEAANQSVYTEDSEEFYRLAWEAESARKGNVETLLDSAESDGR